MTDITFRTDDNTRWGTGQGSDLTAREIDLNFWFLYSTVLALQEHAAVTGNSIDFFNVIADQMYIHMTNHEVLGPFKLPTAAWNFRGEWTPVTVYAVLDVVTHNGSMYLVTFPHTSAGSFDPAANDGLGHDFYRLMLENPANSLPAGGVKGMRLVKTSDSPFVVAWEAETRIISTYIKGFPDANELVMQYVTPEALFFPSGLPTSEAFSQTAPTVEVGYQFFQNGSYIGEVDFRPSPRFSFIFPSDVVFERGDVFTIVAPSSPDPHQIDISISIVGTLMQ